MIVDARITFHTRDVGTRGQGFGDIAGSFHKDCVNNVEGAVLKPTFAQPLQHRPLGSLSFIQQSAIHETPFLGFGLQKGSRA